MSNDSMGIMIIIGLICIALFGGVKQPQKNGLISSGTATPVQKVSTVQRQQSLSWQIQEAQIKVAALEKQILVEEAKKTQSQYKGIVTLSFVNHSLKASDEYVAIKVRTGATPINITGWRLTSTNTGHTVIIPQASYLYFTQSINSEEDIYVNNGDTVYLVTGLPPNGVSFQVNKCSGYTTQFQKFIPYISNMCPLARNEDTSLIPKIVSNDSCFDYLNSLPRCRVPTTNLQQSFTGECTNFINNTINYPSCVNIHKNDADFYQPEWRVYLKRNATLWKDRRENIILYDNQGKIVTTLTY